MTLLTNLFILVNCSETNVDDREIENGLIDTTTLTFSFLYSEPF